MADTFSLGQFRELLDKFRDAVEVAVSSGSRSACFEADKRGQEVADYFEGFMEFADGVVHESALEVVRLTARVMDVYPDAIDTAAWRMTI